MARKSSLRSMGNRTNPKLSGPSMKKINNRLRKMIKYSLPYNSIF